MLTGLHLDWNLSIDHSNKCLSLFSHSQIQVKLVKPWLMDIHSSTQNRLYPAEMDREWVSKRKLAAGHDLGHGSDSPSDFVSSKKQVRPVAPLF